METKPNFNWKIQTQALHGGEEIKYADAQVTPIFASSTFQFPNVESGRNRFEGTDPGFIYTRLGNPTVLTSEKKLAILEGANLLKKGIKVVGHAFSTGMSCIGTTLLALAKPDDTIIAPISIYGGTNYFLDGIMHRYRVTTKYLDLSGEEGIERIIESINPSTSLIYLESPANPNLAVCDIREICKLGKEHDLPIIVDNTFATPILQRPLELGADISLHSSTKYLNGYGTTCSGILASQLIDERAEHLLFVKKNLGATQSPFDAFLVILGMKTLPLRMERHCKNAMIIAEYLEEHPKVDKIFYPGLKSHPQHGLAKRQMGGKFGGMIAAEVKGGLETGQILMNNLNVFTLATSLGCVESLIQHPASMSHAKVPREARIKAGITDGLIRISVGLENVDDLIEDLSQALTKV
jgi:methionine-gamma-lyase